jgi:L-amino acid N-acyltransferase YncA
MLTIEPLSHLEEALELALVRNQCRLMMTQDQKEIIPIEQKKWFETFYCEQDPKHYHVWLLKESGKIIGYFAAKEGGEGFYVTEAIREKQRGQGLGSFLLKTMIGHKLFIGRTLFADIFKDNIASIQLHKKYGFVVYSELQENITRYSLEC